MTDFSISYDLLFDVLRFEKTKEELQPLEEDFYNKLHDYIESKESKIIEINTPTAERELTRIQLSNVKKIFLELYERRERKIINLAFFKLKTGQDPMTTNNMQVHEKAFYDEIFRVLSNYRGVLDRQKVPEQESHEVKPAKLIYTNTTSNTASNTASNTSNIQSTIKSLRFLKSVPKFLGPEMENYGPFEQDEMASLPILVADILVKKSYAEEIEMG